MPHGDNHDLWIDPADPQRMIEGNDGGATVSFNGARDMVLASTTSLPPSSITSLPIRARHIGSMARSKITPTISVASRSNQSGITRAEWEEIGGGESGYIAVRPDDPNIVFAGSYFGYLSRYDSRTGQARNITVWPEALTGHGAQDARYRFQWTCPTVLSPHNANVLYTTEQPRASLDR